MLSLLKYVIIWNLVKVGIMYHEILLPLGKSTLYDFIVFSWICLLIVRCCNLLRIILICSLSQLKVQIVFQVISFFIILHYHSIFLLFPVFCRCLGHSVDFVISNLRFLCFWIHCSFEIISKITSEYLLQNRLQ